MRILFLGMVVALTASALTLTGCGGCESKSKMDPNLSPVTPCLELAIQSKHVHCGGDPGQTAYGQNGCKANLVWPASESVSGVEVVVPAGQVFEIPIRVVEGPRSITVKVGAENVVAAFTP